MMVFLKDWMMSSGKRTHPRKTEREMMMMMEASNKVIYRKDRQTVSSFLGRYTTGTVVLVLLIT